MHAQLVDVEGAGFRFRHALTRDAVVAASLPAEQARLARRALDALTAADPELDGELGPLAAGLAAHRRRAGPGRRPVAAERPAGARRGLPRLRREPGRARPRHRLERDWPTTSTRCCCGCARSSGQTERAASSASSCSPPGTDPTERADVHLVLGAAELGAGRWDAAEEHATAARTLTASDPARLARGDALAAEAAVGRNDLDTGRRARHRRPGRRPARPARPAVECEALEVIGRAERGRDMAKAEAAFTEAHDIAAAAGLRLWQVRALQELGTIDLFGVAGARPARSRRAAWPCRSAPSSTAAVDRPAARRALRRAR